MIGIMDLFLFLSSRLLVLSSILYLMLSKSSLKLLRSLEYSFACSARLQGSYLPSFCLPGSFNFIFSKLPQSSTVECGWVFLYFVHLVVPMGISPMGNSGRFTEGQPATTESRYPTLINYKMHAGCFRVSIILSDTDYRILTCVRDHSYACVCTRGLGTQTASQHNIFDSDKLSQIVLVLLKQTGFKPRVFGS